MRELDPETLGGEPCRVLDLSLMPQLAAAWKLSACTARVWVKPDYKPARLQIISGSVHATILIQKLGFSSALPPSSWQPTPDQASDIIYLSPALVKQALDSLKALKPSPHPGPTSRIAHVSAPLLARPPWRDKQRRPPS